MAPNNPSSPNTVHPPSGPERQGTKDPFAFIDPSNIQELRYEQHHFVNEEEGKAHPLNLDGRQIARERALAHLDELRHNYLRDMGIKLDKNDPTYQEYLGWVTDVSIDNMDETSWRVGTVDAEGKHIPGGRETVADLHDAKLDEFKRSSITHRLSGNYTPPNPHGQGLSPDVTQPVHVNPNIHSSDPNQTQTVTIDPDAKIAIPMEMINNLDVERNNEIQTTFNHLYAAREKLATLAKGSKETPEYKSAQREWAYFMAEYGRLKERQLKTLDPNRTKDDFVRDATWYAIDQISRLDELSEQKKDEMLHRKLINTFKKNKVVQSVIMGVTLGAATLAQKKDPGAAVAAAVSGLVLGPTIMAGADAMVNGRNAEPYTSFSPEVLSANIRHSEDIHAAARFLGERFTKGEKERRKKAGRKAVLGGLATTVALISTSMLPEHIDWHGLAGAETIDGNPTGHEGSASATRPDHNPFDVGNSGDKGEQPKPPLQPETPKPPVQPEQPQPPVVHPEIPPIFTPEVLTQGMNVPLEWGEGALAVSDRLGLSADQQQRFLELLSERHDGSTYMGHDGVRLYFNGGALHLSPTDLLKIINP